MGATRALVTVKNGITYINDAEMAKMYMTMLVQTQPNTATQGFVEHEEVGSALIKDFTQRMRAVAGEIGAQMAMTRTMGESFASGGQAYKAARKVSSSVAESIRRDTPAPCGRKHDFGSVFRRPSPTLNLSSC